MASPERRATVTAVERFLPDRVLSNQDLEKIVDTSDEWIRDRTGISERRILDDQPTSYMATEVAKGLLRRRGCSADDIDLIIVATITPDMVLPATACLVQDRIGATNAWAFDLAAACSGFVYALVTGAQFIASGAHKRIMVIGADRMSAIVDPTDRSTCILFGDGAGGVLLEAAEDDSGLIDFELHADGSGCDDLCVKAGGSLMPATHETVDAGQHFIRQEGRAVFKFAVSKMAQVSLSLLKRNGLSPQDLDLFVPHQANKRIIDATSDRMGISADKVMINIERVANTTAATVPIALSEALDEGRLQPGHLVQVTAVGGGLTWGSALLRWGQAK
ncbi:MAG: ketoacyl-ACP synthase III [Gemmatimonadetes bacterium]|nr:ketoacyl-ACP synthase III [Gemmatimonadota bacterium]MBT7859955.1 ketoacyl-ACP synthase III [Gemmatimonadota bacterium]